MKKSGGPEQDRPDGRSNGPKTAIYKRRRPRPDYSLSGAWAALVDRKAEQGFVLINEKLEVTQEIHTQ
jgi:hypothetical protein